MSRIIVLTFALLAFPALCFADEEAPQDCSSGQKLVSFADGNNVTSACIEEGSEMAPTEENMAQEGEVDPGNYD